jgi:hypothetical protein
MSDSVRALCSDFYVNQKLGLRLDLPRSRETVLDLFDRIRRQFPAMSRFRRYRSELALESDQGEDGQRWAGLRSTSICSGCVNPGTLRDAYALHEHILEIAPYFLSISPLDIEYLEILYGIDLAAKGNHDRIIRDALFADSPLAALFEVPWLEEDDAMPGAEGRGLGAGVPIECQPLLGVSLTDSGDMQAHFEVKSRSSDRGEGRDAQPISIYLTLRRFGPFGQIDELPSTLSKLSRYGEELLEERVIPSLLVPIRASIDSYAG